MHHISDEELLIQAKTNKLALEELFSRYESKLLRYVMTLRGFEKTYAEEVVQDVFLKVWKNINNFDTTKKFSAWVYKIAHNEATSLYRKIRSRGLQHKVPLEDVENIHFEGMNTMNDEISAEEIRQIVTQALQQLPEKYKEVLLLQYVENKSHEEMSLILQKPMGTIAILSHRAKKKLEEILTTLVPNIALYVAHL